MILNGLPPGPHRVLIQLENANHETLDRGVAKFTIPEMMMTQIAQEETTKPFRPVQSEPPAKIIVDSPRAEPLSRGVVFIPYRAEHLQIVPVYGSSSARRLTAAWSHPCNGG